MRSGAVSEKDSRVLWTLLDSLIGCTSISLNYFECRIILVGSAYCKSVHTVVSAYLELSGETKRSSRYRVLQKEDTSRLLKYFTGVLELQCA